MEKKILALTGALVLAATLIGSAAVLASNVATQSASSAKATTITVVGKVADTAVGTITFPEAAADATVSNPSNDVDGTGDPQVLDATASEPVVRLKNTSGGTLKTWLSITTWQNSIAASEDYELVVTTDTTVAVVDNVLSADGNAATVDTTVAIPTTEYRALYLELVLGSVAGKTGTSTLTILGETS